ncbi:MAG: thiaminase II [Lachnospirales bacterium]
MKTTKRLLEATKEIWDAYNNHPFVKGIEDGTLDKEKFKYYIIQDFRYLIDYAKVFSLGIAKTKNLEMLKLFSSHINILTDGEMDIHKGYIGVIGITEEELYNTPIALGNISYTSYMLRIAYEETEVEILTALLACAYSYEVIGKTIVKNNPKSVEHEFYGEWIKGYSCDEYSNGNVFLLDTLNVMTKNYSEKQIEHLTEIFINCSKYEMDFWNLAWNMEYV